jgi:p-hydroxybenzoate 3-monooxygenase
MHTAVVIVGGGPAGALLAHMLHQDGVEAVVVEQRSREYVLARIRAGVLEQVSCEILRRHGLGTRMDAEGFEHDGVSLAFAGRRFRVDFRDLTSAGVRIYAQTQLQKDLYAALDADGVTLLDEARDVRIGGIDGESPFVSFTRHGVEERIGCDFIAGCDGSHGVSRDSIPRPVRREFEREYPFGWLGIISETPPLSHELIYANHPRGFALCSMRTTRLSRYYVQCPLDATVDDWPDDRIWGEIRARLPEHVADDLVTGPSIEKSIAPLRSFVSEPMRHGRLFLAGDAAHVVPPTGAKGLNLAIADVTCLAHAFAGHYHAGDDRLLEAYSDTALSRVWKAVRFSWWMTNLMHRFPEDGDFGQRVQDAELDYLSGSVAAQTAFAENYVGLAL